MKESGESEQVRIDRVGDPAGVAGEASFDPQAYWETRLGKDFDLQGVGYHGLGLPYNRWLYRVRRRIFRRVVREFIARPAELEVLDIGSGTGFYIDLWRQAGVGRLSGSDLTQVAVDRLGERFAGVEFRRLDISGEIPNEWRGRFDCVSAFDVLFHIVDDARYRKAVENAAALLKPGGLFIFTDSFLHGPTYRVTHAAARSDAEIRKAVEAAGLRIERQGPVFVLMNHPGDTRGRFWSALWIWLTLPVRLNRRLGTVTGFLLGALLYPLEVVLTTVKSEGPSTEYAVCRKIAGVD